MEPIAGFNSPKDLINRIKGQKKDDLKFMLPSEHYGHIKSG